MCAAAATIPLELLTKSMVFFLVSVLKKIYSLHYVKKILKYAKNVGKK